MRALSIRQPWAWAILHAGKRVENRDWSACHYRGPVLLHASKGCTRAEYQDAKDHIGWVRRILDLDPVEVPPLAELDRGGLVGIARIVDARRNKDHALLEAPPSFEVEGLLGLVLEDVRPLPFVPFKGALGFFNVELDEHGPGFGTPHKAAYEAAWRELLAPSRVRARVVIRDLRIEAEGDGVGAVLKGLRGGPAGVTRG